MRRSEHLILARGALPPKDEELVGGRRRCARRHVVPQRSRWDLRPSRSFRSRNFRAAGNIWFGREQPLELLGVEHVDIVEKARGSFTWKGGGEGGVGER